MACLPKPGKNYGTTAPKNTRRIILAPHIEANFIPDPASKVQRLVSGTLVIMILYNLAHNLLA
ncbi:MAG: hypothetical protein PHY16_03240 [Methylobacter sp.]|nr:hypothetical protein [Methylobacter sp.]